jgi:hypothetical protein
LGQSSPRQGRLGIAAARGTCSRGGKRRGRRGTVRSLPPQAATTTICGRGSGMLRQNRGGAGLGRWRKLKSERRKGTGKNWRGSGGLGGKRERAASAKKGGGGLGVRVARQRVPRIPRAVAVRPNPSAGGFLEGGECSVPASGTLRARGREPGGAAERPTVSGRAAGRRREKQRRGRRRGERGRS